MTKPMNICVYCGSSTKVPAEYIALAGEVGTLIAQGGHTLIWGGSWHLEKWLVLPPDTRSTWDDGEPMLPQPHAPIRGGSQHLATAPGARGPRHTIFLGRR